MSITKEEAIIIANKDENLKTSFYRKKRYEEGIVYTYLYFSDFKVKKVKVNGRRAWKLKVTDGKWSSIEVDLDCTINSDGYFIKERNNELSCLVYMDNGEYEYLGDK